MLIRALAPLSGVAEMQARRGTDDERLLCSGPGRLCQALGVDGTLNSLPLDRPPFQFGLTEQKPSVAVGKRIGITRAADQPWRFGLVGSPFVSRRF